MTSAYEDLHQWVSFEDPDEHRTWVFDLTFLTSNWNCIYGDGCLGVLTGPAPERELGCCSYGAHFTDRADRVRTEKLAKRLTDDEWQFKKVAAKRGGPIYKNADGDWVSRLADDACIFLNRTDHPGGAGCALHQAAIGRQESIIDWKPEVCWQAPLRRIDETDDYEYVTSTVREWKRRDWGEGGAEFHWWCTETHEAFTGREPVYRYLEDELVAMCGRKPYDMLVGYIEGLGQETPVPHPALKRRAGSAD